MSSAAYEPRSGLGGSTRAQFQCTTWNNRKILAQESTPSPRSSDTQHLAVAVATSTGVAACVVTPCGPDHRDSCYWWMR